MTTSVDASGKNNATLRDDPIFESIKWRKEANYQEAKSRRACCLCCKRRGDDYTKPKTIRIAFNKRPSICNMATYCLYRVLRVVFVSVWFYYFPIIVMVGQTLIPVYYK